MMEMNEWLSRYVCKTCLHGIMITILNYMGARHSFISTRGVATLSMFGQCVLAYVHMHVFYYFIHSVAICIRRCSIYIVATLIMMLYWDLP